MPKPCSTCGVQVTHEERKKDTRGNYLCRSCANKALEKKRGIKPPTANSGGPAANAAAGAATSTVVPTQADWDTLFKCSFCSRRRQEGSDTCGTCWPMKR